MKKSCFWEVVWAVLFSFLSISSHADLVDRGGGLIYDTVLDITWAQSDVARNWDSANIWVEGLTLGGATEWRLPYISVAAGSGPFSGTPVNCKTASEQACRDNELGYMFYYNLGGTANQPILASGDPDLAMFPTLQSNLYWSGTESSSNLAWMFIFGNGLQENHSQSHSHITWAVHPGDIAATVLRCDLNDNGIIDAGDLSQVLRMVVDYIADDLDCDLSNDGLGDGVITAADLVIAYRIANGIIPPMYN